MFAVLVHDRSPGLYDRRCRFDGWLTLPAETIERLELQWRRRGRALLADGSECVFDIYEGRSVTIKLLSA